MLLLFSCLLLLLQPDAGSSTHSERYTSYHDSSNETAHLGTLSFHTGSIRCGDEILKSYTNNSTGEDDRCVITAASTDGIGHQMEAK